MADTTPVDPAKLLTGEERAAMQALTDIARASVAHQPTRSIAESAYVQTMILVAENRALRDWALAHGATHDELARRHADAARAMTRALGGIVAN